MKKVLLILISFLIIYANALAEQPPGNPAVIQKKRCESCHRFSKDSPPDKYQAPDLFYAGNKFQRNWLMEFLQDPVVIRQAGTLTGPGYLKGPPARGNPHPRLTREEAGLAVEYLMSLMIDGLEKGIVDDEALSKGEKVRVKILFERNFGCTACHKAVNLAGKPKGGISGPSLVDAGNRLDPDWIFHWLKNSRVFISKGRMPLFNLEDETAIQISKYIMTLRKENLR